MNGADRKSRLSRDPLTVIGINPKDELDPVGPTALSAQWTGAPLPVRRNSRPKSSREFYPCVCLFKTEGVVNPANFQRSTLPDHCGVDQTV